VAKSVVDYMFRYMGMKFLSPEDKLEVFGPGFAGEKSDEVTQVKQEAVGGNGKVYQDKNDELLANLFAGSTDDTPIVVSDQQGKLFAQTEASNIAGINTDAPACSNCGTLMRKAGSCYNCPNCFMTTGVCD